MNTTVGRKSFVICIGLAMLLSAFVVGGADEPISTPDASNIIFDNNFDAEAIGIQPASWNTDSNFIYQEIKVDNTVSHSNPNSMKLKSKIEKSGRCYSDSFGAIGSNVVISSMMYFPSDAGYYAMSLHSESADWSFDNLITQVSFDDGAGFVSGTPRGIIYYSPTGYIDTIGTWTPNTWFEVKIQLDFQTNTFDAWIDDFLILDNGDFYKPQSYIDSISYYVKKGNHNIWVDDIMVTELLPDPVEEVDLSIYDQDIIFSNPTPQTGDTVNIQATVHGDPETYEESTTITTIFEDDFESGNLNKWVPSYWNPSGLLEVTNSESHSAPYSMHMQSYPYVNTGPWVANFFDNEYEHIKGETWFYLPEKIQEYEFLNVMRLGSVIDGWTGGTLQSDYALMIMLKYDDYSIDIVEGAYDEYDVFHMNENFDIYELTPLTWHKIGNEIDGNQFTIFIDDEIVFQGTRMDDKPIDYLFMGDPGGSSGGGGDAYWDDVVITSIENEVVSVPGLDATCTVSFYLDDDIPENLIYQEHDVFVPGGGNTVVSFDWIPEMDGYHDILVDVTETNPSDYDLSNNLAENSIDIQEKIITFATATGPQGAHHDPDITITYEWTGNPEAVCLYYSSNGGDEWTYLGIDFTVDGFFSWTPEDNSGPKPSKYYWIANALNGLDYVGIPPNDTPPEAGPFNWKTFDVKLGSTDKGLGDIGWHFISVPLGVSGEISAIFDDSKWGDGGTTWDCIKWYNPTDNEDPWKTYRIGSSTNDLFDYSYGMGVWIHITSNNGDGFLTAGEGIEAKSTSISLFAGWNMVGYPTYCDTKSVGEALWGTGADRIEIFDPAEPYLINKVGPSHIMIPGAGYWIHVPVDTVWVVDW